jgi:hypothetical protein
VLNKILRIAVSLLAGIFISGCSDDDCPTCTQENPILFVCTASFRPEEPIGNPSELAVFAGFMSDPIPVVSRFAFLENELEWTDGSLPSFSGHMESPYIKRVNIEIVADDHSTQFDIVIPDSFRLIEPLTNVTAGQSLPFHWSRSADAEYYGLRITIVRLDSPEFEIELDTSISTQDTTFVLDATHVKANCDILLDLRASIGKSGGAGVETNFENGRLHGFVAGSYEASTDVIRTIEPH